MHWTSPFSIKSKIGVLEYILEKTDMISDYTRAFRINRWNKSWKALALALAVEQCHFFAPAWNGLILRFTITAFYGAVVWYSFELKEYGTDLHLITVNSPLVCGPLSDARPITTNTTSHHLQGPRVFRCAFMMMPFALKRLLRNLRPVHLLTVPQSGAGWRSGPIK